MEVKEHYNWFHKSCIKPVLDAYLNFKIARIKLAMSFSASSIFTIKGKFPTKKKNSGRYGPPLLCWPATQVVPFLHKQYVGKNTYILI